MTGFLRRAAVVLWAAFGFMGVGVILGYLWLDRAFDRASGARPMVQFVDADQRVERDCPAVFVPGGFSPSSRGGAGGGVRGAEEDEERRHMLRISQILTLIEAEVATPEIEREFCAELETLPAATYDRLAAMHPAFGQATAQVCQVIPPANDAGVEE